VGKLELAERLAVGRRFRCATVGHLTGRVPIIPRCQNPAVLRSSS
jgi:hypothetical protein